MRSKKLIKWQWGQIKCTLVWAYKEGTLAETDIAYSFDSVSVSERHVRPNINQKLTFMAWINNPMQKDYMHYTRPNMHGNN